MAKIRAATSRFKKSFCHSPFSYTLFSEVKVLNGITELAKILKERENNNDYSPLIGIIIQLPNLKVRLGDKV